MEDYKSNKPTVADSKKRSGQYPTNSIKTVDHLPTPFKTDLNKKWLDSTLDQMLSKGDLETIDAYIGDMSGKSLITAHDHYLNLENRGLYLEPTVTTRDGLDNFQHKITVDDISNSIAQSMDEYDFNGGYSSKGYVYSPPIDLDKFINYVSYYWVSDLPVYESVYGVGLDNDPITTISGTSTGTYIDGSNTVELFNGMRVSFGVGYASGIVGSVYVVTGVGSSIEFKVLEDASGREVYSADTLYSYSIESIKQSHSVKDYIVMDRGDVSGSAWSRANYWVHKDSVVYLETLVSFNVGEVLTIGNRAKRSILEFDGGMELYGTGSVGYVGVIDYILSDMDSSGVAIGSRVLVGDSIYEVSGNVLGVSDFELQVVEGNTFIVNKKDMYFSGGVVKEAQSKLSANQAPLFELYDNKGVSLSAYDGSTFEGSKVFSYKLGTGKADVELGIGLVYRDNGVGANIVFENNMDTESYTYSRDLGHAPVSIPGYYFFKKGGVSTRSYVSSAYVLGAKKSLQVITGEGDVIVPIGYNDWRVDVEYVVTESGVTEVMSEGVYNKNRIDVKELLLEGGTYAFKDMTLTGDLAFMLDGVDLYVSGSVVVPGDVSTVIEMVSGGDVIGRVVTIESQDKFFHTVSVDGKVLESGYVIGADSTMILGGVASDSVVDVEYYGNGIGSALDVQVPDVHSHNANNESIGEFTIQGTLSHWLSMISSVPGFEGEAFGDNNYHKSVNIKSYGGEIFMHDDMSIMHDLCYAVDEMNVAGSLSEQGRDWWSFKQQVIAQTKRMYKTKVYADVVTLTQDVIEAITQTRKGTAVHKLSNMLYSNDTQYVDVAYVSGVNDYHLGLSINNDDFRKDHMYLYLTDNRDSDDVSVTRLLVLGEDYTLTGSVINLIATPIDFTDIKTISLRAYYYQMDSDSNVPASMAKLGLAHTYRPQVNGTELIGHDGSVYVIKLGAELSKVADVNFDPVAAVLNDIETRVYNGMRKQEVHHTNSYNKYLPSVHKGTWYTLNHVDNYVEKYFKEWYNNTAQVGLTPVGYYDAADEMTWNYSSIVLDGLLVSNLPGHWKGAYSVIFGTSTPHLTPWHMLGYNDKPEWWDNSYSWTDVTKRASLIDALKLGLVYGKQNLDYAMHNWDFVTKCPVDVSGELASIAGVLGTPNALDQAAAFVYGDWGPVEINWRNSSLGQAAMIDAVVKLNPTRAWTDFFQANMFATVSGMVVDRYKGKLIDSASLVYDNEHEDMTYVESIKVASGGTGFPLTGTRILISGDTDSEEATGVLDIDATGTIIGVTLMTRGHGYKAKPSIELQHDSVVLPKTSFIVAIKNSSQYRGGINNTQTSYGQRNFFEEDIVSNYKTVDTRLSQKLGGFTASHLIKVETESGVTGKYILNQSDAPLVMYTSKPSDIHVACNIMITKNATSFTVDGISNHKQQFKFLEPSLVNVNDYKTIELSTSATIKKYNKYLDIVSVAEYGAEFPRIQDVYSFVRGNYTYLNSVGYQFGTTGDAKAVGFAKWAVGASVGDTYVIPLSRSVSFVSTAQVVLEYNTLPGKANSVLNMLKQTIESSDLILERDSNSVTMSSKSGAAAIASIGTATVSHEHAILFENTTQFNEVLFDDVTNIRQNRFKLIGQRTRNWVGAKQAPGYLVRDNTIIQNFDSTVEEIANFYDLGVDKFNQQITKAENLMIGNVDRDWVNSLGLSNTVATKLFQGVMKAKGTKGVIQRVDRSKLINDGRSTLDIHEEFMFRQSNFGDTTRTKSTEIVITPSHVEVNPSVIDFGASDVVFVNNVTTPVFEEKPYAENTTTLLTAGDLLESEADNVIFNATGLETLFDTSAAYANIETWDNAKSYKFGDKVRREGILWSCNVDYIGYTPAASSLVFVGDNPQPSFDYRSMISDPLNPSATIDGVSIWFDKQKLTYSPVVATSIASPSVLSPSDIIIDSNIVSLVKDGLVSIIDTTAWHDGNPFTVTEINPGSDDVTGLELIINGVTVNLEAHGDSLKTYTPSSDITNALALPSPAATATLLDDMSSHDIGTIVTPTDTLVEGIGFTYDTSSQVITFTSPLTDVSGTVNITVNLLGFTEAVTMTKTQLKTAINTVTNVTGVNYENDTTRVSIVYDVDGDVTKQLTISTATGNTEFGMSTGTYNPVTEMVMQGQLMDETYIANAINAAAILENKYVASVSSNILTIEKKLTTDFNQFTTLQIQGASNSDLQFPLLTTVPSALVNETSTAQDAVDYINAGSIVNVTASVVSGRVSIESTNASINLGSSASDFNTKAGMGVGGVHYAETGGGNTFDEIGTDLNNPIWKNSTTIDPALFNIWMSDDSELLNVTTGAITSKFFGWNVLQVHTFGYHATITAGTETDDGNDARVTLNNIHNVEVGDYVMLTNTTTTPSVDGFHRVTRLGAANQLKTFYIDRFIETDGTSEAVFVLRSARFNRLADITNSTSVVNADYNWNVGDMTWSTEDIAGDGVATATHVYVYNGTSFVKDESRSKNTRVTNAKIESVLIYNGETQQTINELEIFDPLRGIIPGVADKELDFKTTVDAAVYNTSTDLDYNTDEHNSWGEAEIGRIWWDTSKVKYYDYEQGTNAYRAKMWGKQFPNSSIDVYEWTKSSVHPEEWTDSVDNGVDQFGTTASGVVYSVFDKTINEDLYYYTTLDEWDDTLQKYDTTYYFWVKNKTTIGDGSALSVSQIASIISNPSDNGISWAAAIDTNVMIVNNIKYMVGGGNSVLQINLKQTNIAPTDKHSVGSHNNWVAIKEKVDRIPDYWYNGLRDNLTEQVLKASHFVEYAYDTDTETYVGLPPHELTLDQALPTMDLHEYNRYGDNRNLVFNGKTYSQGWFKDAWNARREAIITINALLKHQNLLQDLSGQWDRTITKSFHDMAEGTIQGTVSPSLYFNPPLPATPPAPPSVGDSYYDKSTNHMYFYNNVTDINGVEQGEFVLVPGRDINTLWDYVDYTHISRDIAHQPSIEVGSYGALELISPDDHALVSVRIAGDLTQLDKSEIYQWVDSAWLLVEKKNATIAFNDFVYNKELFNGWDGNNGWDGYWDSNPAAYMQHVIHACRYDLFIDEYIENFNKMFFAVTKYAVSEHDQVDWVYKTTYVHVNVATGIVSDENKQTKYARSTMNEISGYINTVKPYHTKVKSVLESYNTTEKLTATLSDSMKMRIKLTTNGYLDHNDYDYDEATTIINASFNDIPLDDDGKLKINTGGSFTSTPPAEVYVEIINGVEVTTEVKNIQFISPSNFNKVHGEYRRSNIAPTFNEQLSIKVITDGQRTQTYYDNLSSGDVDYGKIATPTRTYSYIQDNWLNTVAVSLQDDLDSTLSSELLHNSVTISVVDGTKFNPLGGLAYVAGELIQYAQASGNTLNGVIRAIDGTINRRHAAGTIIIDVTDAKLDIFKTLKPMRKSFTVDGEPTWYYGTTQRFDVYSGKSILDSTAEDIDSVELQASGKGIE